MPEGIRTQKKKKLFSSEKGPDLLQTLLTVIYPAQINASSSDLMMITKACEFSVHFKPMALLHRRKLKEVKEKAGAFPGPKMPTDLLI